MTPLALTAPTGVAVMPMRRVLGAYLDGGALRNRALAAACRYSRCRFWPFPPCCICSSPWWSAPASAPSRPENLPILLLTGFSVMGVMGPGIFGFGVSIAMERDQGLTRLKRAQPMPPAAFLVAKMVMAILFSAVVAAAVGRSACWCGAYRYRRPARGHGGVESSARCRSAPSASSSDRGDRTLRPGDGEPGLSAADYLSGLFFPMPESIRWMALFSPAFHLNQLALSMGAPPSVLGRPVRPCTSRPSSGVTMLFAGLAVRETSPWSPSLDFAPARKPEATRRSRT